MLCTHGRKRNVIVLTFTMDCSSSVKGDAHMQTLRTIRGLMSYWSFNSLFLFRPFICFWFLESRIKQQAMREREMDRQDSFLLSWLSCTWKQEGIINGNNWPLQSREADIGSIAGLKETYLQSSEVHLSTFCTCWHFTCVCLQFGLWGRTFARLLKNLAQVLHRLILSSRCSLFS